MNKQEILTIIILVLASILILFFLILVFYFLNKKINKKKISEKEKIIKTVKFENFYFQLKDSLEYFSRKRIGALIVLKNKEDISSSFFNDGVWIDGEFSESLLKNIFFCKETPLHDGATIIEPNYRISYASVIFLIPRMKKPIEKFGARHNAAKVIVNQNDVIAIVVSEISGNINVFTKTETIPIKKNNYRRLEKIIQSWQDGK